MAYGDPQKYCEIYEVNSDHNGRKTERVVSRWRAPSGVEPSPATLERQAEWEAFVDKFQQSEAGAASNEKWQRMEQIFQLP